MITCIHAYMHCSIHTYMRSHMHAYLHMHTLLRLPKSAVLHVTLNEALNQIFCLAKMNAPHISYIDLATSLSICGLSIINTRTVCPLWEDRMWSDEVTAPSFLSASRCGGIALQLVLEICIKFIGTQSTPDMSMMSLRGIHQKTFPTYKRQRN